MPCASLLRCGREGWEIRVYAADDSILREPSSPYEAAAQADALLILTEWAEFATLDLDRIYAALAYPIIVDGRNLFDPAIMSAHGFLYYSVGRPDVRPSLQKMVATQS